LIHVAYEDERRIEVWTIDRPRAANAIDRATFASFQAAVDAASARIAAGEPLRGVILAAASTSQNGGKREVFLSGADLREVEAIADEATARHFAHSMMTLLGRLERLPALVVAAISGDVYGGGCEIVTACDLRIAEEGVQLAFRQTRIGVASGWGGMTRLVRLLGLGGVKKLLLTGIPCETA
jgi:enoyl-CoA hydratase/carnithine racemase